MRRSLNSCPLWASVIASTAALLNGCAVGPDYQEPQVPVEPRFTAKSDQSLAVTEPISERWWQNFKDPVLDELVSRADMQNIDLRRSLLALEEYRAQYTIDFAKLFPEMNTGLSFSNRQINGNSLGIQNPDVLQSNFDNWEWNIASAAWEIDVWGAVRRQIEAGVSRVQMSAAGYRAALVSIRAEVAQAYVTIRQLQAQRKAFRDLATGYGKLVVAIEKKVRYQAGSKVELGEVRSRQSSALAESVRFDGMIARQLSGLCILLAETPERVRGMVENEGKVPSVDMPIAVGIPSTLLMRRPDVQAAERNFQAATAEIGVAEAGYLPRFTFTGNFIIQTPDFSDISNVNKNMTYGITPAINWNFMNILTGAAEARVKQAKARSADALLRYQLTVVTAVNQVEASISAFTAARAVRSNFTDSAREINSSYDLAFMQYNAGTIDISRLIEFLQASVLARNGLAQAEGLVAQDCVELYRSLGGGWENSPMPTAVDDVKRFNPTPTANDFLAPTTASSDRSNG
jgi:NodT family efflux transporter outer membrane factor (OMF) lipoprotein